MSDLFTHARRRLGRAKHHIAELEKLCFGFLGGEENNQGSLPIAKEAQPDGRRRLSIQLKPFPEDIEHCAVDAIAGLRASLDYSAYAASVALGSQKLKRIYFPFGDTAKAVDDTITSRCAGLPPEIADLFRSFEPYDGGKGTTLWVLNKLRVEAEHHRIVNVGLDTSDGIVEIPANVDPRTVVISDFVWDQTKNQIPLAEVGPEWSHIRYNFKVIVRITFPDAPLVSGKPVTEVFKSFVSAVDSSPLRRRKRWKSSLGSSRARMCAHVP